MCYVYVYVRLAGGGEVVRLIVFAEKGCLVLFFELAFSLNQDIARASGPLPEAGHQLLCMAIITYMLGARYIITLLTCVPHLLLDVVPGMPVGVIETPLFGVSEHLVRLQETASNKLGTVCVRGGVGGGGLMFVLCFRGEARGGVVAVCLLEGVERGVVLLRSGCGDVQRSHTFFF